MEIKLTETQNLQANQLLSVIEQHRNSASLEQLKLDYFVQGILSANDFSGKGTYEIKNGALTVKEAEKPMADPGKE